MKHEDYYTIPQLAKILGISRIALYKRVKRGQIDATRIGRNYAIPKKNIASVLKKTVDEKVKKEIEKAVEKTFEQYGDVLRKLGNE